MLVNFSRSVASHWYKQNADSVCEEWMKLKMENKGLNSYFRKVDVWKKRVSETCRDWNIGGKNVLKCRKVQTIREEEKLV